VDQLNNYTSLQQVHYNSKSTQVHKEHHQTVRMRGPKAALLLSASAPIILGKGSMLVLGKGTRSTAALSTCQDGLLLLLCWLICVNLQSSSSATLGVGGRIATLSKKGHPQVEPLEHSTCLPATLPSHPPSHPQARLGRQCCFFLTCSLAIA
jgi:hypothetical protein